MLAQVGQESVHGADRGGMGYGVLVHRALRVHEVLQYYCPHNRLLANERSNLYGLLANCDAASTFVFEASTVDRMIGRGARPGRRVCPPPWYPFSPARDSGRTIHHRRPLPRRLQVFDQIPSRRVQMPRG